MARPLTKKAMQKPEHQKPTIVGFGATASNAKKKPASATSGLEALLAIEDRIRSAENENELIHLIANETRKLVAARQILVVRAKASGQLRVAAISSLALVDRDTPFVRWMEAILDNLQSECGIAESVDFELPAFADPEAVETTSYPFAHFLWQPLKLRSGEVFSGLLLARERPWTDSDKQVLAREARVFVSIWQSLSGAQTMLPPRILGRWLKPIIVAVLLAVSFKPVSMTTLAPVEIVAADPHHVTAPIDGVVQKILAEPNRLVKAGQSVILLEDTTLRNRFKVVEREMQIAQAKYDRARQAAFSDEKARHELAIALNEFRLKQAERNHAAAQLAKTIVRADRDGIVLYVDRDKLLGRPVRTGERLMLIADPTHIAARIELPVADAIVLEKGSAARLFLDSNPLSSVSVKLETKAYQAEPNSTHQLVYRLMASFETRKPSIRIGARGTAQLYGDKVPLIYFLLRRPIAAARQFLGL